MSFRLLQPIRGLGPEDEAAFDAYASELTWQLGVLTATLMIVFIVAWWPLDAYVKPDERYEEAFAALRWRALAVDLVGLAALAGSKWVRHHSLVVAPVLYGAFLASMGYSLGALGGPDLSWLADAWLGIVPVAFIPLRWGPRLLATSLIGATLPAAFFLPFPENLQAPALAGQLSFCVFAVLFTVAIGELMFRVIRREFFQKRELDRVNAELSALTGSLSQRVAEKTRELRSLARHLDAALESERRRIARDLHDDLGQNLTAMRYALARLDDRLPERPEAVGELIEDLSALVDGTSATVRGFLTELRPRVLDDYGLAAAAEWLCEHVRATGAAACTLVVDPAFPDGDGRPEPETALALFRVVQEATTNALKHAGASAIEVALAVEGDAYTVRIGDDGVGFDPTAAPTGFGLLGLRERLHARGGELRVESSPRTGTRVTASLPAAPAGGA